MAASTSPIAAESAAANQRTYGLIRETGALGSRRFEIVFGNAGAEVYCFTFG